MREPDEKNYFYELLIKAYEGQLSPDEAKILNERIKSDPQAAYLYAEFFDTVSGLVDVNEKVFSFDDSDSTRFNAWLNCLADAEKEAPAAEVAVPEEPKILIQKVQSQEGVRKISKGSLFTLFAAAAAIILIFVFAHFAPPATGFKVAILSDSIHAKWADMDGTMEKGTPILTSREKLLLREGYAELLFDNNARVTIEGPAEFQILTDDQIKLQYGRLYAIVPQEAIGFTVTTQTAKVIDLGTEFGVESDARGDTYLHVIKGKTTLIGGQNSNKVSMEVSRGDAKKVSAETSVISNIPCNTSLFVREINSQDNFVWKGQKAISLADIVGGGNGLGTGKTDMGFDPITGEPVKGKAMPEFRTAANEYHLVPSSPYVDGVFIPNGQTKQIISSQGHIFRECPSSGGSCYGDVINTIRILDPQTLQNLTPSESMTVSCILMHANMGITYDLGAIRDLLPGVKIVRFQSRFGIEKEAIRPGASNADFRILVDGKLRHQKTQVKEKTLFSVDLELSEKDRFLTLITTDGGDPEGRVVNNITIKSIDSDWCMFANPVLIVE